MPNKHSNLNRNCMYRLHNQHNATDQAEIDRWWMDMTHTIVEMWNFDRYQGHNLYRWRQIEKKYNCPLNKANTQSDRVDSDMYRLNMQCKSYCHSTDCNYQHHMSNMSMRHYHLDIDLMYTTHIRPDPSVVEHYQPHNPHTTTIQFDWRIYQLHMVDIPLEPAGCLPYRPHKADNGLNRAETEPNRPDMPNMQSNQCHWHSNRQNTRDKKWQTGQNWPFHWDTTHTQIEPVKIDIDRPHNSDMSQFH